MKPEPDLYSDWKDWAKAVLLWLAGEKPTTEEPVTNTSLGLAPGIVMDNASPTVPPGWLLCDGREVSRTQYAQLWQAIGTRYGAPSAADVFKLPDGRDRVRIGRGNMGGSAAGRVTTGVAGIDTSLLGATGGSQFMHEHNHSASVQTVVTDLGHRHGVNDPLHGHILTDAGHSHAYDAPGTPVELSYQGGPSKLNVVTGPTAKNTGNNSNLGVGLVSSVSGVTTQNNTTGISVQVTPTVDAAGAGGSQNVPPCIVLDMIIFAGV